MAARDGMIDLLRRLRGMTQVGTAQYTVGTVTWWNDDQLQEVLDLYRLDYYFAPLKAVADVGAGGSAEYINYYAPAGNLEKNTSGTVYFQVENGVGSAIGTAGYTVDYVTGLIRFNSNQEGTPYYLRARSYNLNAAAAQIWREMAGSTAAYYSFKSDNQDFKRSEWFDHCWKMAGGFEGQSGLSNGLRVSRMTRTDLQTGEPHYRYPNSDGKYMEPERDE